MKFLHTLTRASLILTLLVSFVAAVSAQRTIKGKVSDSENGEGLIGASVSVVGTTRGANTDLDGNYTIEVPAGATQLRFAYTGYTEQTVTLGAANVLNVALVPGSLLDEVVVVGYSTVKKSDLTGAVASVAEKDFNQGIFVAPDQLIQGKAAGVQIINNSGQPGGAATVRIRGNSSIRAGNQPLYVVDGIQLTGASTKPGANTGDLGSTAPSNPLNYLNPNDIESMQVLKDASATAIYGSRGANGVIIITTKRGKAGTPSIQFNTSVGASSILKSYDVLTADEYRSTLRSYGLADGDYGANVDAMSEILRSGITQNHGVSISGGSDQGTYRVGLSYLNQEGIIKNNDINRLSANISGAYKFLSSKRLMLDFSLIASKSAENAPPVSTNPGFQGNIVGNALQWNPTHKMYNTDGSPVVIPEFGNTSLNPVALLDAFKDRVNTLDILGNIAPSFKLTDNLTYKFAYAFTHGAGDRRTQLARWINITGIEGRGLASYSTANISNQIATHTLNYINTLGSGITVNALVGYEYQKRTERGYAISAQDFDLEDFDYANIFQASTPGSRRTSSYSLPVSELQSYFVQGQFNIKDRFLVNAIMRADGSSKFGANNKYGYFPAVGLAWNLHNEGFLSEGMFDNLKLRANYGLTGNSEFPAGAAQERYAVNNVNNTTTVALDNVANPDLKWETTTTTNVGIDFAIMNFKVNGSVDYFIRNTKDILLQQPTVQPAPATFFWKNLDANLINKGFEFSLSALLLDKDKINWNVGGNLTLQQNKLTNYSGAEIPYGTIFGQGATGAISQLLANDQPLNSFYVKEFSGIGEDGISKLSDEQVFAGDPNPNVLAGIFTTLNVNKFSFNMAFNGAFGHQIYNNTKMTVVNIGNLGTRNLDASLVGVTPKEAVTNPISTSTRYLENGNYMKLANATLSYNLGNLGSTVKNARIYVTGQNLLIFTKYSGFDPEVNTVNVANNLPSAGIEYLPYPSARTIIAGANFSF